MSYRYSKNASSYLDKAHELQTIFIKIKALQQLQQLIIPLLDPTLAKYCQVANLVNQQLIMFTSNGSVATQLRFQTNDLLKRFQQTPGLERIRDIQLKVRPTGPAFILQEGKAFDRMPPLTPETAEILRGIADSIEDPKLREVMLSIAGRKY